MTQATCSTCGGKVEGKIAVKHTTNSAMMRGVHLGGVPAIGCPIGVEMVIRVENWSK